MKRKLSLIRLVSTIATTAAILSCRICLTDHVGSISDHITLLVISSLGEDMNIHKQTNIPTPIDPKQKAILRNGWCVPGLKLANFTNNMFTCQS